MLSLVENFNTEMMEMRKIFFWKKKKEVARYHDVMQWFYETEQDYPVQLP